MAVGPKRRRYLTGGILLGVLLAGVLVLATVVSASTIGRTGATHKVTVSDPYGCDFPVLGRQQLVVTLTSSVPSLVKRGATFELTGVRATVTIPGALVDTLMSERRSLDWTIDHWQFTGSGVRPSRYEARPSLRLGPTSLLTDAIGAITSSKTTTLGPFRAVRGGSATITPSTLELTTWLGHLRCTRSSSSAVSSVVVTVTGKHSSTPTPVGGDLGALGAAALLGGAFAWRQRKHPLSRTRSAS